MKLNITNNESEGVLKFSGTLDIYAVDAARDVLIQHVQNNPRLILDLSEVEECDVAGLQLLFSVRKTIESLCKSLEVKRVSQAIIDACAALGLGMDQLTASSLSN